jgi:hypothetical protein
VTTRRRGAAALACILGGLLLLLLLAWSAVARGAAADRLHRAESDRRDAHLSRQIANRNAVLESQRLICMARFRRLEAQIQQRDGEIALRTFRALRDARPATGPPGRASMGPPDGTMSIGEGAADAPGPMPIPAGMHHRSSTAPAFASRPWSCLD